MNGVLYILPAIVLYGQLGMIYGYLMQYYNYISTHIAIGIEIFL